MAMSEEEVQAQLHNMVNFIHKEAQEKAQEIRIKAEEEYNIEKTNIVQEQKKKINSEFEEKMKKVEVSRKIAQSNQLNQCRLAILRARETAIQSIFTEAQSRLINLTQDKAKYVKMLEKLILQGLLKLKEQEIQIYCRAEDHDLVEKAVPEAIRLYRDKSGIQANIEVSDKHRLAAAPQQGGKGAFCSGGVVLSAREGRIMCNNSLDQRLGLAAENLLPEIRTILFGVSQSRKFTS